MLKKFSETVAKNDYYKAWLKDAWPYVTGALLLSVFQIVTLAVTGKSVSKWYYFASAGAQAKLAAGPLQDPATIRNIGLIFGALFAALIASGFKIKKIKSPRQVIAAVLGGLTMGYGARIALGCNIGAFYSGIASLSLSGWVFGLALFIGAVIGSKMLVKYFM